ncbi:MULTISPECIES: hypothetical protein [unclassified Streptomyces]|uniref:hypothetical protein n=1 Tax=unclassified Streptomyces TaxID=2593676 RepID=UPI00037D73CA|nr:MULTISPECIES: hypothetical protein [unclassified Streptomyces]MYY03114.1 hypothetical protein [Streptomyces sp. SID4913]
MPQQIKGDSRLVIGRFLYDWHHQDYLLLAYAHRGHEGMGVVGTVADAEGRMPDLWSVAARHCSLGASAEEIGRWCLCSGWARTMSPRNAWIEVDGVPWTFDVRNTLSEIRPHQYGTTAYGWRGAYVGTLTLEDPDVIQRAHDLMRVEAHA